MNRALPMWAVLAITAILLPDTPLEAQTPGPRTCEDPSNPVALDQPIPGLGGYTLRRDMRRESLANQPRVEVAARLAPLKGRPLLIVQAKQDSAPTVSEAVAAYAEAARAVSTLPFDHVQIDGDHNFTREDHRQELGSVVVGWMTKHCT